MRYFAGAMVGINLMLIWFGGILLTDYQARIRVLEYRQIGMEAAQKHSLARMEKATVEMVNEVKEVLDR